MSFRSFNSLCSALDSAATSPLCASKPSLIFLSSKSFCSSMAFESTLVSNTESFSHCCAKDFSRALSSSWIKLVLFSAPDDGFAVSAGFACASALPLTALSSDLVLESTISCNFFVASISFCWLAASSSHCCFRLFSSESVCIFSATNSSRIGSSAARRSRSSSRAFFSSAISAFSCLSSIAAASGDALALSSLPGSAADAAERALALSDDTAAALAVESSCATVSRTA